MMAVDQIERFDLQILPGGGAESPTLWWAASRFMQGARRFHELQTLLAKTASSWTGYPQVGTWDGQTDLEIGELSDEFFNTRPEASALASEAVFHFRAALDSAVYQLAWRGRGERPSGTMFPFCKTADSWPNRRRSDLRGLTNEEKAAVADVQPFRNVAWSARLAELSNRDKHDHTLEIASVYSCTVDTTRRMADVPDPRFTQFAIVDPALKFVFVPVDRKLDGNDLRIATDDLIIIMQGITEFLNPLLEKEGVSKIELESQLSQAPSA
ncbi:hypothetical protein [Microterricola pindariensis]|uniref:hypothetical protein n=1 Tax=Microterricola pindariensis TaxID=478010 RepID=UPI0010574502|nr:hypothetical protein [Microterricola pindariensis]